MTEKANHATASGMRTLVVIVVPLRQSGCRRPRTSSTVTAEARTHCPVPPVLTQARSAAHGAHEVSTQLKSSVQLVFMPKPAANQPSVPSSNVTANAVAAAITAIRRGQNLGPVSDAVFTPQHPATGVAAPEYKCSDNAVPLTQVAGPARHNDSSACHQLPQPRNQWCT